MDDDAPDLAQTLELASAALAEPLTDGVPLGGSTRSLVLRARRADGSAVVVKRFVPETESTGASGYEREAIGLELLGRTPTLLAVDPGHELLVISDVGAHPTLADHLRGDDPDLAWASAMAWARGLGELVAGSTAAVPEAARRLDSEPAALVTLAQQRIATGVAQLAETAGIAVEQSVLTELATAIERVGAGRRVLSPGDTCPDNVLLTPDGPVFIDLEGTDVHPIVFDAAYARLPFATCWCVYAQPPGFTAAMSQAFVEGVGTIDPELVGPGWDDDVVVAATGYVLWLEGLMIERADREPDRRMGPPASPSMTFREITLLRLDWLREEAPAALPHTAAFAGRVADGLRARWGELAIPMYPAWAGCC